jgi:hypothetical protein
MKAPSQVSGPTRRSLIASGVALALVGAIRPARAAFSADQTGTLKKIDNYFNSIRTMQGRFIQFGPNGEQSEGVFFISRPGRIRFHYNPPVKMDVICDGSQVAIRDSKMMTQDLYPLSKTPLRYLLADRSDLRRYRPEAGRGAGSRLADARAGFKPRRRVAEAHLRQADFRAAAMGRYRLPGPRYVGCDL